MEDWMPASRVAAVFEEEIKSAGGNVTDRFDDEGLLFARSVLPEFMEAVPGDRLQPGVAIRASETDILVHPYIFRLVCSNGAIMARALHSRRLVRDGWFLDDEAQTDLETTLRVAIQQCCHRDAFVAPISKLRSAAEVSADMAITFSAYFSSHRRSISRAMMREILLRYAQSQDRSTYGLINAVTSVARDTRDPETKWRLESLAGEISHGRPHTPQKVGVQSLAGSMA